MRIPIKARDLTVGWFRCREAGMYEKTEGNFQSLNFKQRMEHHLDVDDLLKDAERARSPGRRHRSPFLDQQTPPSRIARSTAPALSPQTLQNI